MKTKKLAHLSTASLLVMSLTLGACGNSSSGGTAAGSANDASVAAAFTATANYKAWHKLITSDEKNIALAEILSAGVAVENQPLVKSLADSLSDEEIKMILNQVKAERRAIQNDFLFRKNTQLEGSKLYNLSIIPEDQNYTTQSETEQVRLATFAYLKSKALDEIYKSFDKAIAENAAFIARQLAKELARDSKLAKKVEDAAKGSATAEEFSKKLAKIEGYIEKVNVYFKYSDLNEKEQLVLIGAGAIGAALFIDIKESKTFLELMKKYEAAKVVFEEIQSKVDAIKGYVKVINDNRKQMQEYSKLVEQGVRGTRDVLAYAAEDIKNNPGTIDAKKMSSFLYEQVFKGDKKPNDGANPSITRVYKDIKNNMAISFAAAGKMANNLEAIIGATQAIASTLGIKLSPGVQKALATASKVAAGVKVASAVIAGFATGGVMAAVGGISAIGGLMGGGGPDPVVMAALGRIEAKLDDVLARQEEMMKLQRTTLEMIKNLAIMIDQYHQDEMRALSALHNTALIGNELDMAKLNENLRSCEVMIDMQLKKSRALTSLKEEESKVNMFSGIMTYNVDATAFYSHFKTMRDFTRFADAGAEIDYSLCQASFSKAFGTSSRVEGNPILSIYNTSSQYPNLLQFQSEIYMPLVKFLDARTESRGERKKILHMPMASLSSLDVKSEQLTTDVNSEYMNTGDYGYHLNTLVSTKALVRYMSSYILLYPVMEFDKKVWELSLEEVVDTYYEKISSHNGENDGRNYSRAYQFMTNALDYIQSGIAQESILAGESLIPIIYKDKALRADLLSAGQSKEAITVAARSNRLLMQNYLAYTLKKKASAAFPLEKYAQALASNNVEVVSEYLDIQGDNKAIVKLSDDKKVLSVLAYDSAVAIEINLPTAEMVEANMMIYSENMPHLLKMQRDVLGALVKIAPSDYRTADERTGLAKLMIVR